MGDSRPPRGSFLLKYRPFTTLVIDKENRNRYFWRDISFFSLLNNTTMYAKSRKQLAGLLHWCRAASLCLAPTSKSSIMIKSLTSILVCAFLLLTSLSAQERAVKLSTGILYTNINSEAFWFSTLPQTILNERGGTYTYPWRRGWWATAESELLSRKFFQLSVGLTYQERPPLEVFPFPAGSQAGVPTIQVLGNWPSNPQNPLFSSFESDGISERFPNFRYLHLEVVPSFRYSVGRFELLAGIGLFGGRLLNQRATTREIDDFGEMAPVLRARKAQSNVAYTKADFGWLPKVEAFYRINDRLSIGVQAKYYRSIYRLNNTLVKGWNERAQNARWQVFAAGLSAQYAVGKERQVSGF
jgi:hypothetical protein